MLYTTQVEKVILVSTIPSNLALDAPVNEEKRYSTCIVFSMSCIFYLKIYITGKM